MRLPSADPGFRDPKPRVGRSPSGLLMAELTLPIPSKMIVSRQHVYSQMEAIFRFYLLWNLFGMWNGYSLSQIFLSTACQ